MTLPILNLEELRGLEARAAVRLGNETLMRRAGEFAGRWIAERLGDAQKHVALLVGPGNNGGDALCAAKHLRDAGFRATVVAPCGAPKTKPAEAMWNEWLAAGGAVIEDPYTCERPDCVVDGLFGIGLSRPISGNYLDGVLWFNERRALKVALDIPSGLNPETGCWIGSRPGVRADATITFLCPKAGLFMREGPDAAGEVVVDELDVSIPLTRLTLSDREDFAHILQKRPKNSHKGSFGRLAVVGGAAGRIGAALLAARAGLLMGAGTVTAELLADNAPAVDFAQPELMLTRTPLDFAKFTAVVVGPGLGASEFAKTRLKAALDASIPVVADADALNLIASDKTLLEIMLRRKAATVITPHEGEGARILGVDAETIASNRVDSVRDLALKTGAATVLKGPGTLVAMRSTRTWLTPTANASLATAGSGDVLAGMIGSFLAQRYDTIEAVLGAVTLHAEGAAGRYAGATAGRIAENAAERLHDLRASS